MAKRTKPARKTAETIIRLETIRASQGSFHDDTDSSESLNKLAKTVEREIHETQVQNWDTRRALALSTLHRGEAPISYIRSLLQRGNLADARAAIQELQASLNKGSSGASSDPELLLLLRFEEARLGVFESNWNEVISKAGEALALNPAPATRLALFQLRANAHFELGEFAHASRDIEEAEMLAMLFPHAVSALYVRTLKVRVLARDRGLVHAQNALNEILAQRISSGKLDLDLLLTFLRVQIDLNRLGKRSFANESLACFLISDAIGDKLYSALAEMDWLSSRTTSIDDFLAKTASLGIRYSKIARLRAELEGTAIRSTSSVTIGENIGLSAPSDDSRKDGVSELLLSDGMFRTVILILTSPGLVADLEARAVHVRPPEGQTLKALQVLSVTFRNPLTKREFFAAIWGRQAYSPRLHDTLISSLLHRLKKNCGVLAHVEKDRIRTEKRIFVI